MADLIINSNSTNYFSAIPVDNNFFSLNSNGTYNLVTDGETKNLWTVKIDRKDTMDDIMTFSIDGLPASANITTSVMGYNESNNLMFNKLIHNSGTCQVSMYMTAFIVVNITQNMPLRKVNCNELKISLSSEGVPWESAFMTGNEIPTISQFNAFVNSQLKTDTMANFCAYMGIPYTPTLVAADGVTIVENRSKVDGNNIHIEVDVTVDAETSGTLFSIPESMAPSVQFGYDPNWVNAGGGIGRYVGVVYLDIDGTASINDAISVNDDVKATIIFDYTI